MIKGKTAENENAALLKNAKTRKTVLGKHAKNVFFFNFQR
jgi:hypothetical protein